MIGIYFGNEILVISYLYRKEDYLGKFILEYK